MIILCRSQILLKLLCKISSPINISKNQVEIWDSSLSSLILCVYFFSGLRIFRRWGLARNCVKSKSHKRKNKIKIEFDKFILRFFFIKIDQKIVSGNWLRSTFLPVAISHSTICHSLMSHDHARDLSYHFQTSKTTT